MASKIFSLIWMLFAIFLFSMAMGSLIVSDNTDVLVTSLRIFIVVISMFTAIREAIILIYKHLKEIKDEE